jgi:hypothetical protein
VLQLQTDAHAFIHDHCYNIRYVEAIGMIQKYCCGCDRDSLPLAGWRS